MLILKVMFDIKNKTVQEATRLNCLELGRLEVTGLKQGKLRLKS